MYPRLLQTIHSFVPLGLVLWLLTWFVPQYDQTERIILFAAFVVVPLTLFAVLEPLEPAAADRRRLAAYLRTLAVLFPVGAVALAVSFALAPGVPAGVLSAPWSAATFAVAALGARLFADGWPRNSSILIKAAGFVYIAVAGVWLIAHQFGMPLLGFEGQIMLLTVNHFHYAGFVVPVLFGFLHEHHPMKRLSGTASLLGAAAPILIALGMTFSPALEWLSVLVFTGSLLLYSLLVFGDIVPRTARWTRGMHIASAGVIWGTMALAAWYGYGEWSGQPAIAIPEMILLHGWGNAVLLSFFGVLAWHAAVMGRAAAAIPFSRLQGGWKIGADIFRRLGAVDGNAARNPTGLSDDFREYEGGGFLPERLHPDIIDFYEHTAGFDILVTPRWSPVFRPLARVYKLISGRVEQMNFPLAAETNALQVRSEIVPIRDDADGRTNVRSWVRTYAESGKTIYAALYSTHRSGRDGVRYMNIAFPLPGSQMSSILRLSHDQENRLTLTSWADGGGGGDQGVYWVRGGRAVRLPINETITVWKDAGAPGGSIEARHDMWLYGVKFLTLEYRISRKGDRT